MFDARKALADLAAARERELDESGRALSVNAIRDAPVRGTRPGLGKKKGWSDEARKAAALSRAEHSKSQGPSRKEQERARRTAAGMDSNFDRFYDDDPEKEYQSRTDATRAYAEKSAKAAAKEGDHAMSGGDRLRGGDLNPKSPTAAEISTLKTDTISGTPREQARAQARLSRIDAKTASAMTDSDLADLFLGFHGSIDRDAPFQKSMRDEVRKRRAAGSSDSRLRSILDTELTADKSDIVDADPGDAARQTVPASQRAAMVRKRKGLKESRSGWLTVEEYMWGKARATAGTDTSSFGGRGGKKGWSDAARAAAAAARKAKGGLSSRPSGSPLEQKVRSLTEPGQSVTHEGVTIRHLGVGLGSAPSFDVNGRRVDGYEAAIKHAATKPKPYRKPTGIKKPSWARPLTEAPEIEEYVWGHPAGRAGTDVSDFGGRGGKGGWSDAARAAAAKARKEHAGVAKASAAPDFDLDAAASKIDRLDDGGKFRLPGGGSVERKSGGDFWAFDAKGNRTTVAKASAALKFALQESKGKLREAYPGHESLDRSPKKNWVERAGKLPAPIQHMAKDIHEEKGVPLDQAIPIAISQAKKLAAKGNQKYVRAVAEWEALKAKNKAKQGAKTLAEAADELVFAAWDRAAARALSEIITPQQLDDLGQAWEHPVFNPAKHVRDREGQFAKMLDDSGDGVDLPDGTSVTFGLLHTVIRGRGGTKVKLPKNTPTVEVAKKALSIYDSKGGAK